MAFFPVSDSQTLSDKVVEQIKQAIAEGQYLTGEKLPAERELAEMFKVSRTVVRDAVKVLAGTGVISVRQGVGAFVTETGAQAAAQQIMKGLQVRRDSVRNLFEIRKVLEAEGAAWAAMRCTPADMEELDAKLREGQAVVESESFDPEEAHRHNREFHTLVATISRNDLLMPVLENVLRMMEGRRRDNLVDREWARRSVTEHKQIVAAIRNHDPEAARWAMKQHLGDVEETEIAGIGEAERSVAGPPKANGE